MKLIDEIDKDDYESIKQLEFISVIESPIKNAINSIKNGSIVEPMEGTVSRKAVLEVVRENAHHLDWQITAINLLPNVEPLTTDTDCVSRSAVIEMIRYMDNNGFVTRSVNHVIDDIRTIPTATPTRKKRMDEQTIKDIDRAFKALEERDELLDKIRAEINRLTVYYTTEDKKINLISQNAVNRILDKYKGRK